nr:hypothetical protein [Tanacetum cinerariifolium]
MANEMQQRLVRDDDDDFDPAYADLFSMKVHHGGKFTPKGRREYVLDNISFVDFAGYENKVIDVYIEHDFTTLDRYFNGPRDGIVIDDNIPPLPSHSEGFPKVSLQTPPSSKPLTIGEEIQLKSSEISWVDRDDCAEDMGYDSSKGKEPEVDTSGSNNGKESEKLNGLPYKHVVAAIWNAIENQMNGGIPEDWVHPCYRLKTWKTISLRQGEIPWLEREDYREDIGCGSSKGKETKEEASGNEAEYFDPFEDLDDIL